jgi:hypothetical protein
MQQILRRGAEGLEYQLQQLLSSAPESESEHLPDWLQPLVVGVARSLAIMLLLALLYGLVRLGWSKLRRFRSTSAAETHRWQSAIAAQSQVSDWLEQAKQAQLQEDYATACRALYMALLLRFAEGRWLAEDPARTDQEYLKGLDALWVLDKRPIHLRAAFYQIFQTHERLYYGAQTVNAETFQRCQTAYQTLESNLLQKGTTSQS